MLYALRKLIAFVFLGGIFWFIYRDPANIGKPAFMNTLGILVLVFGLFWLTIPGLVVTTRIRRRLRQNRAEYAKWLAAGGPDSIGELPKKTCRLELADGEKVYAHEKGTVYVESGRGFDAISVKAKPGDVAFPKLRETNRKMQRTHYYLTDRRIAFAGKSISCDIPFGDLLKVSEAPGGLVFTVRRDNAEERMAFTFPAPPVAAAVLAEVRGRSQGSVA